MEDFFHQPYWHHLGSMHFSHRKNRRNQKFVGRDKDLTFRGNFLPDFATEITKQSLKPNASDHQMGPILVGIQTVFAKMYAKIWVDWFPRKKKYVVWLGVIFSWPPKTVMHEKSEAEGSLCRGHCGCQGQIRWMVGLNGLIDGFCGERQIDFVNVNLKYVWYLSTKRESNFQKPGNRF